MGLTSWAGDRPRKADVGIAKDYLNEDELRALNLIVAAYLDFASSEITGDDRASPPRVHAANAHNRRHHLWPATVGRRSNYSGIPNSSIRVPRTPCSDLCSPANL